MLSMISQLPIKQNILVVDDSDINIDLVSSILIDNGFNTLTANNGKQAIEIAKLTPIDIVLLDIDMPEMNGFETCEFFKKHKKLKNIPIIFLSALTAPSDKVKAFELGCIDYIPKPFQLEEVLIRVTTHLKVNKLQKQLKEINFNLKERIKAQVGLISKAQMATILALSKLAESRDDDTGKHIERIRFYCKTLSTKIKEHPDFENIINDEFIENMFHAAPLHDIGKVAIPDSILLKPGKLTNEEFEIMKNHSVYGANTLKAVAEKYPENDFINLGIKIARSHHEKWNGTGYPDKLSENNIPIGARVMAIADVYDALRSERVYKKAFTHEQSVKIIKDGKGSHFDPVLTDIFLENQNDFDKIRNAFSDYEKPFLEQLLQGKT